MKGIFQILILGLLVSIIGGCGLFQASPELIEESRAAFVALVDKAAVEVENGQKVLAEIRHKVDKEGLKKTKALNTLSDATSIAKAVKDDVIRAQIPQEMEPIREKFIASLDKRIEAYNDLFRYYDFEEEKFRVNGDALLKESLEMFGEVQQDIEQYRK